MAGAALLPALDETKLPPRKVIDAVTRGLPVEALAKVADAYGVTQQRLAEWLDVPPRTLQRRRSGGSFDASESERLYRYVRLFRRSVDVFDGDETAAREFLTSPQPGLDGAVPVEMARAEYGATEVMDLLGRLDYGVYT